MRATIAFIVPPAIRCGRDVLGERNRLRPAKIRPEHQLPRGAFARSKDLDR
jgi:hypothetical protein